MTRRGWILRRPRAESPWQLSLPPGRRPRKVTLGIDE